MIVSTSIQLLDRSITIGCVVAIIASAIWIAGELICMFRKRRQWRQEVSDEATRQLRNLLK